MTRAQVRARLLELILATAPSADRTRLDDDRARLDALGLDSVRVVELGVRVEMEWGEAVVVDDWLDQEHDRGEVGFTLGSFVDFVLASTEPGT